MTISCDDTTLHGGELRQVGQSWGASVDLLQPLMLGGGWVTIPCDDTTRHGGEWRQVGQSWGARVDLRRPLMLGGGG